MPVTSKDPELWGTSDKLAVVLQVAGPSGTDWEVFCCGGIHYPKQLSRWLQATSTSAKAERAVGA